MQSMAVTVAQARRVVVLDFPSTLEFMYSPVIDTLEAGFRFATFEVVRKDYTRAMQRGKLHTYVWIGVGLNPQRMRAASTAGARTIYYQTEPIRHGKREQAVDEIWDFSRANLRVCQAPVCRFVPPGYIAPPTPANERPTVPRRPHLHLLGYPYYRSGRAANYATLKRQLGLDLNASWDQWDHHSWERWWHTVGKHVVHLHLHKRGNAVRTPAFRFSPLLSHGAVFISQSMDPDDEKPYEGLVHFATNLSHIPTLFRRVRAFVGNGTHRRHVRNTFRRRFSPRVLFRDANVYRDIASEAAASTFAK